ncbi:MAG: hypothetical protein AMXMBFR58_29330 [Phycisphaerae bacterium]
MLADDISADGNLLKHAVEQLRMQGVTVTHAVALVDRPEGDARSVLGAIDCELSTVSSIDDNALSRWVEEAKGFHSANRPTA